MNLDDLMAVWRRQDVVPLHGVDKTLLHLALRQDEAKLQKARRIERWIIYILGAGMVAAMALFLAMMIYFHRHRPEKVVTGWDYALLIVGATAALLAGARCMWATGRRRGASNALTSRFEINSTGVSRSSKSGRRQPA